jgi:hypothetical protein
MAVAYLGADGCIGSADSTSSDVAGRLIERRRRRAARNRAAQSTRLLSTTTGSLELVSALATKRTPPPPAAGFGNSSVAVAWSASDTLSLQLPGDRWLVDLRTFAGIRVLRRRRRRSRGLRTCKRWMARLCSRDADKIERGRPGAVAHSLVADCCCARVPGGSDRLASRSGLSVKGGSVGCRDLPTEARELAGDRDRDYAVGLLRACLSGRQRAFSLRCARQAMLMIVAGWLRWRRSSVSPIAGWRW